MIPRTLGQQTEREARRQRAWEPHVEPINTWAEGLRTDGREVPHFDPADGGVNARVLFLLESPGPRVSDTGFISMDNPDGTAANMHTLITESGLSREDLALWNVVPWQLSAAGVVTPDRASHQEALPATRRLLTLLPHLKAVVLVGQHAQRAWQGIGSDLTTFAMPHPSPQNFNTRPYARDDALAALRTVQRYLSMQP
ncbi:MULTISPECIES: uracil-DNA glycosylase [Deinococcus]|uniref:Uracil-DNA glycosylase n=1 Tax=Deinococcus rufus TaxID=2136097 RepID=A0ABV7Z4C9_9DEIO|nr:uracil-DNA glycosylase [Deinococcus sp. AB2017081]WQE95746.1 uracil-DNA glycosylase [Deinococcus sp. AB2017081]